MDVILVQEIRFGCFTICDKFYIELPINLLYVDKKVEDSSSKKTNQVANDGTCSTKIKETLIR